MPPSSVGRPSRYSIGVKGGVQLEAMISENKIVLTLAVLDAHDLTLDKAQLAPIAVGCSGARVQALFKVVGEHAGQRRRTRPGPARDARKGDPDLGRPRTSTAGNGRRPSSVLAGPGGKSPACGNTLLAAPEQIAPVGVARASAAQNVHGSTRAHRANCCAYSRQAVAAPADTAAITRGRRSTGGRHHIPEAGLPPAAMPAPREDDLIKHAYTCILTNAYCRRGFYDHGLSHHQPPAAPSTKHYNPISPVRWAFLDSHLAAIAHSACASWNRIQVHRNPDADRQPRHDRTAHRQQILAACKASPEDPASSSSMAPTPWPKPARVLGAAGLAKTIVHDRRHGALRSRRLGRLVQSRLCAGHRGAGRAPASMHRDECAQCMAGKAVRKNRGTGGLRKLRRRKGPP